jgi:hypothetical protein
MWTRLGRGTISRTLHGWARADAPTRRSSARLNGTTIEPSHRATSSENLGAHPQVVSERLGHATISITLDTHSRPTPGMQEEAAALIAELVFAGK